MIEQLIAKAFALRNAAHLAHWKTKSFAQHVALGDFYDGVIDIVDKLVEAYQGRFGIVGDVALQDVKGDFLQLLQKDIAWLNTNRSAIAKNVPALENIVDELSGLYLTTFYKLANLS